MDTLITQQVTEKALQELLIYLNPILIVSNFHYTL